MSYPLDDLHLHAFRGVRHASLQKLGRVNLIVGPNNSGKTSVLEGIELLSSPHQARTWSSVALRRASYGAQLTALRTLFPGGIQASPLPIDLGYLGRAGSARLDATLQEIEGQRPLNPYDSRLIPRQGVSLEINVRTDPEGERKFSLEFWQGERRVGRRPLGSDFPFRAILPHESYDELRLFSRLRVEHTNDEALIEVLRGIDPRITGAEMLKDRDDEPLLFLRTQSGDLLPSFSFGGGMQRALLLALLLPGLAGGVLAIDEFEVSLHPSSLQQLFRWLVNAAHKMDVQLFLTTHSLEAIDAILDVDPTPEEDVLAFHLEGRGDQTVVKRFSEDLLKRLRRERGLDVR